MRFRIRFLTIFIAEKALSAVAVATCNIKENSKSKYTNKFVMLCQSVCLCVGNRKVFCDLYGPFSQHFNYNYILLYFYHLKNKFQNLVQAQAYNLVHLHPSLYVHLPVTIISKTLHFRFIQLMMYVVYNKYYIHH